MRCRWLVWAAACGAMLFLVVACTASSSEASPSPSTTQSSASSGSAARLANRTVELSCLDGGSGNAPAGADGPTLGGLIFEGLAGDVEGSTPADVGLGVPPGHPLYFIKAPAWLKGGSAKTTIELPALSGGYLAWVPAPVWTGGGGGIDLTPWMTSKLVIDACPDRDSTYFGGLLSTDPHICLTLHVSDAAGHSQQIHVGSTSRC